MIDYKIQYLNRLMEPDKLFKPGLMYHIKMSDRSITLNRTVIQELYFIPIAKVRFDKSYITTYGRQYIGFEVNSIEGSKTKKRYECVIFNGCDPDEIIEATEVDEVTYTKLINKYKSIESDVKYNCQLRYE